MQCSPLVLCVVSIRWDRFIGKALHVDKALYQSFVVLQRTLQCDGQLTEQQALFHVLELLRA